MLKKIKAVLVLQKKEWKTLFLLWITVLGMTAILNCSNAFLFKRFIGQINPVIAMVFSGIVGFFLLSILSTMECFVIIKKANLKATIRYFLLVIVFPIIAILVDLKMVFSADINILFPESLLFYPTIAFLVEILFHILPLSVLLLMLNSIFKKENQQKRIWVALLLVALLEPTFQILMDDYLIWAMWLTWINLYLFNLTQLLVFKKYGFIPMYICRLVYYLIWHIIWGYFRLELLF